MQHRPNASVVRCSSRSKKPDFSRPGPPRRYPRRSRPPASWHRAVASTEQSRAGHQQRAKPSPVARLARGAGDRRVDGTDDRVGRGDVGGVGRGRGGRLSGGRARGGKHERCHREDPAEHARSSGHGSPPWLRIAHPARREQAHDNTSTRHVAGLSFRSAAAGRTRRQPRARLERGVQLASPAFESRTGRSPSGQPRCRRTRAPHPADCRAFAPGRADAGPRSTPPPAPGRAPRRSRPGRSPRGARARAGSPRHRPPGRSACCRTPARSAPSRPR